MLNLPKNVWILAATFSFVMVGISLMLFIGGILGAQFAPGAKYSTLPIAAFVVGCAAMALPAALVLKRIGRKLGGYTGMCASLSAAVVGALAVNLESFTLLVITGFLLGVATPFYQQFRFAVIESLPKGESSGPALATFMLFNIGGALLGPEMGAIGQDLLPDFAPFTGAFLLLACCIFAAMVILSLFKEPQLEPSNAQAPQRRLVQVLRQPIFIAAAIAGAGGYAVMSFLMTSTPISMHTHHGHGLNEAKWVIQSHLVAMFLPSLFSGLLLKHLGVGVLTIAGGALYLLVVVIAFSGVEVMHYWWALVALGVGWNFLFLSGTSLLPKAHTDGERFKTQATNDFLTFAFQGVASLSAGWVLFSFGWNTQLLLTLPVTLALIVAGVYCMIKNY